MLKFLSLICGSLVLVLGASGSYAVAKEAVEGIYAAHPVSTSSSRVEKVNFGNCSTMISTMQSKAQSSTSSSEVSAKTNPFLSWQNNAVACLGMTKGLATSSGLNLRDIVRGNLNEEQASTFASAALKLKRGSSRTLTQEQVDRYHSQYLSLNSDYLLARNRYDTLASYIDDGNNKIADYQSRIASNEQVLSTQRDSLASTEEQIAAVTNMIANDPSNTELASHLADLQMQRSQIADSINSLTNENTVYSGYISETLDAVSNYTDEQVDVQQQIIADRKQMTEIRQTVADGGGDLASDDGKVTARKEIDPRIDGKGGETIKPSAFYSPQQVQDAQSQITSFSQRKTDIDGQTAGMQNIINDPNSSPEAIAAAQEQLNNLNQQAQALADEQDLYLSSNGGLLEYINEGGTGMVDEGGNGLLFK